MKLISVVTPTFNEEGNVREIYLRVKKVFSGLKKYRYEHIFIDNDSSDNTVVILKSIAKKDRNVKIIVNTRNFGWIRSQYYGLLSARGDGVVLLVADLQDPPEMITKFIKKWEEGYKVVMGIKTDSHENGIVFAVRKFYYRLIKTLSEVDLVENFMGFGLFDKRVMDIIRSFNDPYPYFRGLISEIGFKSAKVEYAQKERKAGKTSSNFLRLFDVAMLGLTNYSKVPLRLMTITGMFLSIVSLVVSVIYLLLKIFLWQNYTMGFASLVIGFFFFSSVQLFFIGMIGEYIGNLHDRSIKKPLVVESERINF